jgi:hypothetical protein
MSLAFTPSLTVGSSANHWEAFLGRNDFRFGQFGENFTVEGSLMARFVLGISRPRFGQSCRSRSHRVEH